jgi:phosphatidylserine decarboxylase
MSQIKYLDRISERIETEQVYGGQFLRLLYGNSLLSRIVGPALSCLVSRLPMLSRLYGYLQSRPSSAKKVLPFIKKYQVDTSEFAEKAESFGSFNDFFTRKLLPTARPIDRRSAQVVMPADGRYLFFPDLYSVSQFFVKERPFDLAKLLNSENLAEEYRAGAMVIARLCPTDYHRYHFPTDCVPGESRFIHGHLASVNPLAIRKYLQIYWENKRTLCELHTRLFGKLLFLEVGASFVGTIHQTYTPFQAYRKGDEKGFFSFGGSCLILLFPPHAVQFDADLLAATARGLEIKCLMGQSMGRTQGA